MYAVEASSMAAHAKTLVEANGYGKHIQVICGKVEDVDIKEKVLRMPFKFYPTAPFY